MKIQKYCVSRSWVLTYVSKMSHLIHEGIKDLGFSSFFKISKNLFQEGCKDVHV